MVREAAFDASGPTTQRPCPRRSTSVPLPFPPVCAHQHAQHACTSALHARACYVKKPECMGIDALRVIPVAGPAGPLPKAAALPECSAPGLPLAFRPPAGSPPSGPRPQRLRSRPQTDVRQRNVPEILHPGAGTPMVRAEPFPPGCAPPSPPPSRRPRSRPRRRQSSLPSAKTPSLRTDRPAHPQGPAASSPRRHSRRQFRRRRPRTSSTRKPQIPTRTGPRRRRRSSGGFGPAIPTERLANRSPSPGCRGPAAPACRAVPAPVPRGRGATWSSASGVRDGFDLPAGPRAPPARRARLDAPSQSEPGARDCVGRALPQGSRWTWTAPSAPPGRPVLPAGGRRRARLHPIAAGASGPQGLPGITPLAFRTASASFRKSPGSAVVSPHSRNRIVRIRCPWPLSLRRRAPGPRASVTGCAWPRPTRPVQSVQFERVAQPVRPFRSRPGPQRSEPRPVPPPVNERHPAVKYGQRVGPGVPAGVTDACGRWLTTERRAARRAVDQAHGPPRRPAGSPAGPLPPPPRLAANPLSGASPT